MSHLHDLVLINFVEKNRPFSNASAFTLTRSLGLRHWLQGGVYVLDNPQRLRVDPLSFQNESARFSCPDFSGSSRTTHSIWLRDKKRTYGPATSHAFCRSSSGLSFFWRFMCSVVTPEVEQLV
jgi:hypothetical protein